MTTIQLTQEQKDKLIEMCKKLFPEFVHIQMRNYYSMSDYVFQLNKPDDSGGDGFDAIEFLIEKGYQQEENDWDGKGYSIHWFEFCHEYLVPKILGDYNLIFCGPNRPHPVDYLYNIFKELK